jgi:histidine triad (HIT) family protein
MASGEIPVEKLHDDHMCFALRDIQPRAPKHLLIIPKRHIASANELSDDDDVLLASMFGAARRLAIEEGVAEKGYRLTFNVGPEGGQTIYHLHLHLLGGRQLGPEG